MHILTDINLITEFVKFSLYPQYSDKVKCSGYFIFRMDECHDVYMIKVLRVHVDVDDMTLISQVHEM